MKKIYFTSAVIFILFSACESEKQKNNSKTNVKIEKKTETPPSKIKEKKQLTIEGKNIWVRENSSTGDVIMKLNSGDICKILEEGKEVKVKNMLDKWYKIEFNDTIGWVFGSQTNIKSGKIIKVEDFSKFIKNFASKLTKQNFTTVIHKDIGLNIVHNPGAFSVLENSAFARIPKFELNISSDNIFNKKPEGNFCEGYPKIKSGIYFWKSKKEDLPVGVDGYDEEKDKNIIKEIKIAKKYETNQIYKVQLIKDEYHHSYYYFINIGISWYLLAEDYCDCSA